MAISLKDLKSPLKLPVLIEKANGDVMMKIFVPGMAK